MVSGVLNPWARSPARSRALWTSCSWRSSRRLRSLARGDLGREASGQAWLGAAVDAREFVAQASERRQADARLQPGAGEQHQTDEAERDADVGGEGAPQFVDRRGFERHREAEGARRAVAFEPHFALHHVDGGVVGSAPFDRLSGRRQVDPRRRFEILVPQRAGTHPHRVALGDAPVGAAGRQLVARIGEVVGQGRLAVFAERDRAGELSPAHFELLFHQPLDVIFEDIAERQARNRQRRGDRQSGERQQAQAQRCRPRGDRCGGGFSRG